MTTVFRTVLLVIVVSSGLALICCHDPIDRDQPPPGCFSVIGITRDGALADQVQDIEAVIEGVAGGSPTPVPSFIKTKTRGGRSIFRSNRLLDVDPTLAFNDVKEVLKSNSLMDACEVILKVSTEPEPNKGELGSAGQSAIHHDSDSEGGNKPHQEPEAGSR